MPNSKLDFLNTLEDIILARQSEPSTESYTSQLFAAGTQRIAQKVGEEAVEVALAACLQKRDETVNEAADLLYHLVVLLADRNITLGEVVATLQSRHATQ